MSIVQLNCRSAGFRYYLAGDTASYDLVWGAPAQTDPQVIFEGVA